MREKIMNMILIIPASLFLLVMYIQYIGSVSWKFITRFIHLYSEN